MEPGTACQEKTQGVGSGLAGDHKHYGGQCCSDSATYIENRQFVARPQVTFVIGETLRGREHRLGKVAG